MIDPKELRIHNIISYHGLPVRVTSIKEDGELQLSVTCVTDVGKLDKETVHCSEVDPLRIDSNIAVLMGFEYNYVDGFAYQKTTPKNRTFQMNAPEFDSVCVGGDWYNSNNYKFAHHIQNLYYYLTETELIYKP